MKNKTCGECKHFSCSDEGQCMDNEWTFCDSDACDKFQSKAVTYGDRIRQMSNAEMAEKLVYRDGEHKIAFYVVIRGKEQKMEHECWRSTIIPDYCWAEYDRAYTATVEKLKEVYNETTSN